MKFLIFLFLLYPAIACSEDSICVGDECVYYEESEDADLYFDIPDDSGVTFFHTPLSECPSGYGPIKIEFPEEWRKTFGYQFVEAECARVVEE